jgi:hypothetical protein
MTAMAKNDVTDAELDMLLQAAPQPEVPQGFADRLQAKLEMTRPDNVIAFSQKKNGVTRSRRAWLSAIPLAASLAAGLYLGAQGSLADTFSALNTSVVSDASDQLFSIGIEDTESFVNGELS